MTQGRLVELSSLGAKAHLTAAFGLVLEAQRAGETVAWITLAESSFYPPDAFASGVDLDDLIVVRVKDVPFAARGAEQLARSGGMGLIVIDLDRVGPQQRDAGRVPPAMLTRLVGLAQTHDTAIVFLTEKPSDAPALSSLVTLRAEVRRVLRGEKWNVEVSVLKDKRRGPGARFEETCHAPDGMR